jgi:hypothetical protein
MQPTNANATEGAASEPGMASVVASSAFVAPPRRGHFVFGVFQDAPKAETALQKLLAGNFQDDHVLLVRGSAYEHFDGAADSAPLPLSVIAAGAPFAPILDMLQWSALDAHARYDVAPRIAHQITDYLENGGAVLIVAIHTSELERIAARTFLTCRCDLLLTHEVAKKL